MEFDKNKVYTAANADELKIGSKVIVVDTYGDLKECVLNNEKSVELLNVLDECTQYRFKVKDKVMDSRTIVYVFAYLVSEPEEKKLNCCDKMTDRQLAETYVTENANNILDTNNAFISSYEAFLAGLKAGRLKWHDLRKDPNDVPDNLRYVWTNEGAGHYDDDGWWDDFGRLHDVIAWCEPKFEEEQNA